MGATCSTVSKSTHLQSSTVITGCEAAVGPNQISNTASKPALISEPASEPASERTISVEKARFYWMCLMNHQSVLDELYVLLTKKPRSKKPFEHASLETDWRRIIDEYEKCRSAFNLFLRQTGRESNQIEDYLTERKKRKKLKQLKTNTHHKSMRRRDRRDSTSSMSSSTSSNSSMSSRSST